MAPTAKLVLLDYLGSLDLKGKQGYQVEPEAQAYQAFQGWTA